MDHVMRWLDQSGDSKTIWDPGNLDQVGAARAQFDTLRAKGYLAYRVEPGGERGEQISAFDPDAGAIILTPALRGG